MTAILDEHKNWQDDGGKPIVNGKVYFGERNKDAKLNPITIFSDAGLETPTANPQTTDSLGQTDDKIYVTDFYSILVEDSALNTIYSEEDNGTGTDLGAPISLDNVQGINDLTAEGTPVITEYIEKQIYLLKTVSLNTGAMTLDAGAGVVSIKLKDQEIIAGQFPANTIMELTFNSTGPVFDLISGHNFAVPQEFGQTTPNKIKGTTVEATTSFEGKLGETTPASAKVTTLNAETSMQIGSGQEITTLGDTGDLDNSDVKVPTNLTVLDAVNAPGRILQVVQNQTGTINSTAGTIPLTGLPTISQGKLILTQAITPKFIGSILYVEAVIRGGVNDTASGVATIFAGNTNIGGGQQSVASGDKAISMTIVGKFTALSLSPLSFTLRAGGSSGIFHVNATESFVQAFTTGVPQTSLKITEVKV